MKRMLNLGFAFGAVFILTALKSPTSSIQLTVSGITSHEGQIMIGIYDKAQDFPSHDRAYKRLVFKLDQKHNSAVTFKIKDLLVGGSYALAVYHDKNNNFILDKNFFGLPIENYGFSNNARGTFGPPSFEDSKIKISTNYLRHEITLK